MVDDLRPFVVELDSRENTHRRRVNLLATCPDEAAAVCEQLEGEYTDFHLDDDGLGMAEDAALYVPRDSDINGRFIRGGKVLRRQGDHTHELRHARASLGLHHQEKPYSVRTVGSTDIVGVLASMFGLGWQKQIEGGTGRFVWASDTIKVALATSTYTPNVDTHDFFNDMTNEVTGTGYTAGGATLGSKTSTYDTASDQIRLDAADVQWTTSTITARYGVVWYDTAGASTTDPLLGLDQLRVGCVDDGGHVPDHFRRDRGLRCGRHLSRSWYSLGYERAHTPQLFAGRDGPVVVQPTNAEFQAPNAVQDQDL